MIPLSSRSPEARDLRSGNALLLWFARQQWRHLTVAGLIGIVWMLGEAATPVLLGRTIDAGVLRRDPHALVTGCLTLLGVGLLTAVAGLLVHRTSVISWWKSCLLALRLIGYHVADHGVAVTAETTTGEVAESVGSDADKVGNLFETSSRSVAAIVIFPVMAGFVISLDLVAGLWVAIGMPIMSVGLIWIVRPLQRRERLHRRAAGRLTSLGSDTAAGLRVLRGIGGERQFVARYTERSAEVRRQGLRFARAWGAVEGAQILLPGSFVVVLIWLGAHGVLSGRLSGGELVTLYASAAFLAIPLDAMGETLFDLTAARVAADRLTALFTKRSEGTAAQAVPTRDELYDEESGTRLVPGLLTALVSAAPEQSDAIAQRLASHDPAHERIQLTEAEPRLFSGTLRSQLDPYGRHGDGDLLHALAGADALDVLDALPDGLDTEVEERGRGFSGGQRQRIALARALVAGPEVLVLIEPTSSVDAHTEARIAVRLKEFRAGRTTLLTTASPLVLQEADRVLLVERGRVVATGTHRELMATEAGYRRVVSRELEEVR